MRLVRCNECLSRPTHLLGVQGEDTRVLCSTHAGIELDKSDPGKMSCVLPIVIGGDT